MKKTNVSLGIAALFVAIGIHLGIASHSVATFGPVAEAGDQGSSCSDSPSAGPGSTGE